MVEISNLFLVQLFIFVSVFFFIVAVLTRYMKNRTLAIVIGLIISLIVWRYLSYSQIDFAFQVGGWLGILVSVLFPFSMVFFFVYTADLIGAVRKAIWVFYAVVMLGLVQGTNFFSVEGATSATLVIVSLVFLVLLFDKYIQTKIRTHRNLRRNY